MSALPVRVFRGRAPSPGPVTGPVGVKAWFLSHDDDMDFELARPELLEFLLEDLDFLDFLRELVSSTSSFLRGVDVLLDACLRVFESDLEIGCRVFTFRKLLCRLAWEFRSSWFRRRAWLESFAPRRRI